MGLYQTVIGKTRPYSVTSFFFTIAHDTPSVLPSEAEVSVRLSAHAEVRGVAYCLLPIA